MSAKLRRGLVSCLALLSLSACPGNNESTDTPSSSPEASPSSAASVSSTARPSPGSSPKASAKPLAKLKRGIFIYGDDYRVFKACGSKEEVWVQDTPKKDLEQRYKALKLLELEPVYVELSGDIKPTDKANDFSADFQHTLQVKSLAVLKTWVSNGSCFATDFVAQGSPPDWSLQILSAGDVFFKSNEGEYPVVDTLAYSKPKQEGNSFKYEFHFRTPQEDTLQAELNQESCEQNGQSFEYTAKVLFRGSTYTGCAHKPG